MFGLLIWKENKSSSLLIFFFFSSFLIHSKIKWLMGQKYCRRMNFAWQQTACQASRTNIRRTVLWYPKSPEAKRTGNELSLLSNLHFHFIWNFFIFFMKTGLHFNDFKNGFYMQIADTYHGRLEMSSLHQFFLKHVLCKEKLFHWNIYSSGQSILNRILFVVDIIIIVALFNSMLPLDKKKKCEHLLWDFCQINSDILTQRVQQHIETDNLILRIIRYYVM